MTFTEKLRRLTSQKSKTAVSENAGLPSSAISNYITKRQIPRADKALALARALGVPLIWLADDDQEWPPPAASTPATLNVDEHCRALLHAAADELHGPLLIDAASHAMNALAVHRGSTATGAENTSDSTHGGDGQKCPPTPSSLDAEQLARVDVTNGSEFRSEGGLEGGHPGM